jgi:hypothetical protein
MPAPPETACGLPARGRSGSLRYAPGNRPLTGSAGGAGYGPSVGYLPGPAR